MGTGLESHPWSLSSLDPKAGWNGAKEAGKDVRAKKPLLRPVLPAPLEMKPQYPNRRRPSFT